MLVLGILRPGAKCHYWFLRQTIDGATGIEYDEVKERLSISKPGPGEAVALNSLLKQPIFEVREMDVEAIKRLENEIMEEMY